MSAISEAAKNAFRKISKNKNKIAEIKLNYTSGRKIKKATKESTGLRILSWPFVNINKS
jgi:flagellin-like hook-associated protein FlgL